MSVRDRTSSSSQSSPSNGSVPTPASSSPKISHRSSSAERDASSREEGVPVPSQTMDGAQGEAPVDHQLPTPEGQPSQQPEAKLEASATQEASTQPATKADVKRHKHHKRKSKQSKKAKAKPSSSEETSTSDDKDEEDESETSSSSSSEDEKRSSKKSKKKKSKKEKSSSRKHQKHGKSKRRSVVESDSSESDSSDSESESSAEERRRKKQKKARSRKNKRDEEETEDEEELEYSEEELADQQTDYQRLLAQIGGGPAKINQRGLPQLSDPVSNPRRTRLGMPRLNLPYRGGRNADIDPLSDLRAKTKGKKKRKAAKRASTLEFKRVDQLWDSSIHNYKLTESAEDQEDEFDQYVFVVRRRFDWENKYKNTVVDIKSKLLKEALQEVMKDVKGVSLVEDQPSVDPNMLFLYLEELRKYTKKVLKAKAKAEPKKKNKKRISLQISQCKVLIRYIDEDYEETKKTLYPMLEAGNITFDLLWALFKPNAIAYTSTYGSVEDPRCFKVDYATKESSFMRGEWYSVEGRYLEYDGKSFGLGDFESQIDSFKGPRKITSLNTYPLQYHKDPEGLKKQLVERGKTFVAMEGMNYRFHKGMAFQKKKKTVAKVNINGRIMVDPAIFRRINPNYPISQIKPKDADESMYEEDSECSECACSSDDDNAAGGAEVAQLLAEDKEHKELFKYKVVWDKSDQVHIVKVPIDEEGQEIQIENMDKLPEDVDPKQKREFTEEELLIASPVVLGFAFSEKLWLEFSISGLMDIEWNEGAFDSLVLPANQKSIVKALVESHKFHAAKTIDDVVQGKGKGLVAVLHGPPGTGKTLTAEGIAELLKCPLYMVSAGELGTDPRILELELQKILDIAHSWGAVLLLDEADVFLEKREVHDIHRNALVSIFLRLLEYFQGILFLTTNRVETFDDAFQSRIHVALRYGELTTKAKKAVWKMFLDKVRKMEGVEFEGDGFRESDYDFLARNNLNGRQIKNCVRTAQALSVNEKKKLSMEHIKRVLEVAESFEQDLKGGSGYKDAMRSYT